MLAVRRETMLVVWYRASSGARNSFEGSVDVREIKEIRPGEEAFINDVTQILYYFTIPSLSRSYALRTHIKKPLPLFACAEYFNQHCGAVHPKSRSKYLFFHLLYIALL